MPTDFPKSSYTVLYGEMARSYCVWVNESIIEILVSLSKWKINYAYRYSHCIRKVYLAEIVCGDIPPKSETARNINRRSV